MVSERWKLLEWYVAEAFKKKGWTVYPRSFDEVGSWKVEGILTSDQIDVFGWREDDYGTKYLLVECKLYTSKKVGKKEMQKFAQTIDNLRFKLGRIEAFFVTTTDFTREARKIAEGYGIVLINGEKLRELIGEEKVREILIEDTIETVSDEKTIERNVHVKIIKKIFRVRAKEDAIKNFVMKKLHYDPKFLNVKICGIKVEKRANNVTDFLKFYFEIDGKDMKWRIESEFKVPQYDFFEFYEDIVESKEKPNELIKERIIKHLKTDILPKILKNDIEKTKEKVSKRYSGDIKVIWNELNSLQEKAADIESKKMELEEEIKEIELEIEERMMEGRPTKRLKERLKKLKKYYKEVCRQYESIIKRIGKKEAKLREIEEKINKEIEKETQKVIQKALEKVILKTIFIEKIIIEVPLSIVIEVLVEGNNKSNSFTMRVDIKDGKLLLNDIWICSYCMRPFERINRCSRCKTFICEDCTREIRRFLLFKRKLCPKCYEMEIKS